MIPFPYQLNIKGHHIRGKLYSHTGTYVGGKKTKVNSKDSSEIIAVCDANDKMRMAHIHYIIDPPDKCTITLFYFRHGNRLRLFQIYIHETDNFHRVSSNVLDDMIAATLRFSLFRRLWSDALSYIIWMLIALFAFIASCSAYYLDNDSLVTVTSTALTSVFLLILRGPLMNQLGGTQRITATMKKKLIPLCRSLLSTRAKQRQQPRKQRPHYSLM